LKPMVGSPGYVNKNQIHWYKHQLTACLLGGCLVF
jgi:hypothetical protein